MAGADAGGQGSCALAGDVDICAVGGNTIKGRKQALRLGEQLLIVVHFHLAHGVVDTQTIVTHGTFEVGKIGFLTRETFENVEELGGGVVKRVIELHFVRFAGLLVTESFFAQVGDAAVDVQVQALKIAELRGEVENSLCQRGTDLERSGVGFVIELANVKGSRASLRHFDLDEFRVAGLENFAKGNGWPVTRAGRVRNGGQRRQQGGGDCKYNSPMFQGWEIHRHF
jgi:hypothetical protein